MGKLIIPPFILIRETIDKFGYDPNNFKGLEDYTKLIVRTCFNCYNIYEQQIINAIGAFKKNKKCKYCANKERAQANAENQSKWIKEHLASGEFKPPMLGKKHTQESKDKLSKFHKGLSLEDKVGKKRANKLKQEASERFSGEGNPFFNKQHTQKTIDLILKNRVLTDDGRKKNQEAKKNKSWVEQYGEEKANKLKSEQSIRVMGKNNPAFGKIYNSKKGFKKFTYKEYHFRSSWELKVAEYLDEQNIEWTFESIIFDLKNGTTYRPDFYLIKENKWIEVKGYWYEDAKLKFEIFKQLYPEVVIEIWDKEKMKKLNLI